MGGAVSGSRYDHSFSVDDSPEYSSRQGIFSASNYESTDDLTNDEKRNKKIDSVIDGVDYDSLEHYDEDTLDTPVLQNRMVIIPSSRHPYIDYRFCNKLGEGAYSFVFKGISVRDNSVKVAIKEISTDKTLGNGSSHDIAREINILSQLKHKCIVRLYKIYKVQDKTFLVMEYLKGGELLKAISLLSKYHEQLAKRIMKQITLGISYLHSRSVIHRDIKPENIILLRKSIDSPVKIVDFGFAIAAEKGLSAVQTNLITGTPGYMAPEIYTETTYYPATDVWSLGVVFYIMLSGMMPFNKNHKNQIIGGIFTFPDEYFSTVSNEAKDLITRMFEPSPLKRITAAEMLDHAWFQDIIEPSKLIEDNLVARISSDYTISDVKNSTSDAKARSGDISGESKDDVVLQKVSSAAGKSGDLTWNLETIRKFESMRKFRTSALVVTGYTKLKAAAKRRRSSSNDATSIDSMTRGLGTISTDDGDKDLSTTSADDHTTTADDMSPQCVPDENDC